MTAEQDDERSIYAKLAGLLKVISVDDVDSRQVVYEVLDHIDAAGPRAIFPDGVDIATQLRTLVLESGRRQVIAERSGLKPAVVNLFMDGKPGLSIEWAEKLASAVGFRLAVIPLSND
jgi:hypothetical protein